MGAGPQWRSVGTFASGVGDVNPGMPADWQPNDILLLVISCEEAGTISTPAGWTQFTSSPQTTSAAATGSKVGVFYRRAVSGDTAPTITDTGDHTGAEIHAFYGCKGTGYPVDVESANWNSSAATNMFMETVTTTVPNTMCVYIPAHGIDATGAQITLAANNGNLVDIQERSDNGMADAAGGGFGVWTGEITTARLISATEFNIASSSLRVHFTIALAGEPPRGFVSGIGCM